MLSLLIVIALLGWILATYSYFQYQNSKCLRKASREVIPSSEVRRRILVKHQQIRSLGHDLRLTETSAIRVGDVMTHELCFTAEHTLTEDILLRMRELRTRHLVVQDEWGAPVGIVSDRDLTVGGRTAKDVMTKNLITISVSSPLAHAVALMLSNRISCLPIMEEQALQGIITTTDLLMVLDCLLSIQEERSRSATKQLPATEPTLEESLSSSVPMMST